MLQGDFDAAWRISDAVLAQRRSVDCSRWPRHLQHVWDGSPLDGRHVLVRCYHGLGDTLQFVRLLPLLRRRARRVTVWMQPALLDLLRSAPGADELLPLNDGAPSIDYDVDIELMELPHALRLRPTDIPNEVPYIYVSPAAARIPRLSRPPTARAQLRVGLVWCGGGWNPERDVPAEVLAKLASAPGAKWFSLQYPPMLAPFDVENLASRALRELAVRMQMLDLVISVDTMNAHLAGALGLPVWTLLPARCDWRWMTERDDSPWYPTMRLFRQRRVGDWRSVVEDVVRNLAKYSYSSARYSFRRL